MMKIQKNTYQVIPSASILPGAATEKDGVRFTVVVRLDERLRSREAPVLVLVNTRLHCLTFIPLTDAYRSGDLYSLKVSGLSPENLAYCYKIGSGWYNDPCARRLVRVRELGSAPVLMGALSELSGPSENTEALRRPDRYDFSSRFVYLLHVRGFTRERTSGVLAEHRGTYTGITDKISYLQTLGVTTVLLMPVCELTEPQNSMERFTPSSPFLIFREEEIGPEAQSASAAISVPLRDGEEAAAGSSAVPPERRMPCKEIKNTKTNFWGFGSAYYYAPAARYSIRGEHPETEYRHMIQSLHEAGIEVIQQFWLPDGMPADSVSGILRYYVRTYGVDGFQLIGSSIPLHDLASDALLADTQLYCERIPENTSFFAERAGCELDIPGPPCGPAGSGRRIRLATVNQDYLHLLRRFVKADDLVLADFVRCFLHVPEKHGDLRFAADYQGFTLLDTVTYSRKHNEANGEDNRDGTDDNASWNCGVEGPSRRREVVKLRRRLIRNMLTLVFLSEGTPMLHAGDERCNTQGGNNNPYCQDNSTGWTDWRETAESREFADFTKRLSAFRREHPVFRKTSPFRYTDYRSLGYPDLSYHGRDAWKADFSGSSHSIGLLYCEDYETEQTERSLRTGRRHLIYLALNMYWQEMKFGLPNLPEGETWYRVMDTSRNTPFLEKPIAEPDLHSVEAEARSIVILISGAEEGK